MNDSGKKYRRSALSIVCYVIALLLLFYIVYLVGNTVAQVNQYYAQYDMKAQPAEYISFIMQTAFEPFINAVIFFMLGMILDEVRKNNPAYYLSDEEIDQAKIAKQEARIARQEERAAKKAAAAEEAAAAKAESAAAAVAVPEMSVEEDFVRSLDEELSKAAAKPAPRKKTNSGQKKSGENKPKQDSQKNKDDQGAPFQCSGQQIPDDIQDMPCAEGRHPLKELELQQPVCRSADAQS